MPMKKGLLIGCGSAIALFILLAACTAIMTGGGNSPNTTPVADKPAQTEKKITAAKIGDTVKAGDLEYTVLSVESKKVIKDPFGGEYKPGAGQYLVLELRIKNNGKEKVTVDTALFKLKDKDGAEYSADPQADTWINGKGGDMLGFFLKPLNPHATKEGKIVFDVPEKPEADFTFIGTGGFLSGDKAAITLKK
jgi:Domain of unknown function (DUF4352)